MLLILYKTIQALYIVTIPFIILFFLYYLRKERSKVATESQTPSAPKKVTMRSRICLSLFLLLVCLLFIGPSIQDTLLVQTPCTIEKIGTQSDNVPKNIFVSFDVGNIKHLEKVSMKDFSFYFYNRDKFQVNASKVCWYDRIDPTRVILEPPGENILPVYKIVFYLVSYFILLIVIQYAITRRKNDG